MHKPHWAFIDFKDAFNSIPHATIIKRINSINDIDHEIKALITNLYSINQISIGSKS